jgi:hypothetical protein
MGKNLDPDHNSESLETISGLKIRKFFDAEADQRSGIFLTLDPKWKIRIRDKNSGSAN